VLVNYEGRQYRYPDPVGTEFGAGSASQEEAACLSA